MLKTVCNSEQILHQGSATLESPYGFGEIIMLKKTIVIVDVIILVTAITFLTYGIRTACPDVAIYQYCGMNQ
jgi:hypothetical protein